MGTFAKSTSAAAIGGTADSFENVGTVQIPNFATHIHGFLISWAESVRTAAEAIMAQLRFNAPDFNIGNQTLNLYNKSTGGAPATNIQATSRGLLIQGVDIPINGAGDFIFEASSHVPDPTANMDIGISVLFNDGLSGDFKNFFPRPRPLTGSDSEAVAAITATTEAAITDLDIQSWASTIIEFNFGLAPDSAITAGDPIVPIAILRSTFKGFDPQEFVLPSISAILGTPVGNSVEAEGSSIPCEIPVNTGSKENVTTNIKLTTTSATNISVSVGTGWV